MLSSVTGQVEDVLSVFMGSRLEYEYVHVSFGTPLLLYFSFVGLTMRLYIMLL